MQAARKLVSEEEFLQLPESNERIELIDGEVFVSPSSSFEHQTILLRIVEALRAWAKAHKPDATVAISPLDVRFRSGRILQPDAMVFFEALPRKVAMPIDRIPELTVEVLSSSNRRHDQVVKRAIYRESGVREYWLVDPDELTLEVDSFDDAPMVFYGRFVSRALAGFELELSELFR